MSIDLEKIESAKGYLYVNDKRCPEPICVDDYIAYKEIEQELGIDLITLFRALKDGIYYRNLIGGICHVPKVDLSYYSKYSNKPDVLCLVEREDDYDEQIIAHYLFKDYGKTWALTKEELPDEK